MVLRKKTGKSAARWPLLLPALRFGWLPSRLSADLSPGRHPLLRIDERTLICFPSPVPTLPSPPPTRARDPGQMPLTRISKDRPFAVCNRRIHSRFDIAAAASEQTEPPFVHVPFHRFFTA